MTQPWRMLAVLIAFVVAFTAVIPAMAEPTATTIGNLTIDYQIDPLGIETDQPIRFGWNMASSLVGQGQIAYQIDVTDASGNAVWSSGRVESAESAGIAHAVDGLEKSTRYNWTVTVDTIDGQSITSEPASFVTDADMSAAQWIIPVQDNGSMPLVRTEQALSGTVASAYLSISALGCYTVSINGVALQPNGVNELFAPGWTDYNSFVNYQTYDVTDYLGSDTLVLGVELFKGWYAGKIGSEGHYGGAIGAENANELALIAHLVINYEDGTRQIIDTNETDWLSSELSPVLANDFFDGETYDANVAGEIAGWNKAGYDTSAWSGVTAGTYTGELRSSSKAAARMAEEYTRIPAAAYTYNDDETISADAQGNDFGAIVEHAVDPNGEIALSSGEKLIVDVGQNSAGVVEFTVTGPQGATVTLTHAEMLNDGRSNPVNAAGGSDGPAGSLYMKAITNAEVTDRYILSDEAEQTFVPLHTYHGFRYVQFQSDADVVLKNIRGKVITGVGAKTGKLETNNADLNQLISNTNWSQISNYLSLPTDCPQRGERAGWTGDAQLFAATGVYNFDVYAFLENYNEIMQEHAATHGNAYGAIMPAAFVGFFAMVVSSGWSDAGIVIPWVLYQQTGDTALIEMYYSQMDAYMDYVMENGYDQGLFGDWLGTAPASTQYLNSVYQIYTTQLMEKMANAIGNAVMAEKYAGRYDVLKAAFLEHYVDTEGNVLSATADGATVSNHGFTIIDNAQTALLWALKCGLYETDAQRDTMIENLLINVRNERGAVREGAAENTLSVGFLGVNVILPVLTEIGAADVAYDLMLQNQMPSWLYSVQNGATTIWERWNSYSIEESFGDSGMNSFNHYSYGACLEWMYKYMSGIDIDEDIPGFKHIILQPTIDADGEIDTVNGSYESVYGEIVSNWTSEGGVMNAYHAVIPANTSATLYLPITEAQASGVECAGVTFTGMTTHFGVEVAQFELASGGYDFTIATDITAAALAEGYEAS